MKYEIFQPSSSNEILRLYITKYSKVPVNKPTVIYNDMILVAAALDANPTAAINAPIIVTTLHPKRFVKELAMGPAPSVTPTNMDGIKDTDARLVPSNPLINATTNIPKEYVIPSAKIEITL